MFALLKLCCCRVAGLVLLHVAGCSTAHALTNCGLTCLFASYIHTACRGVYYSFTSPPHLDVAVRPLGLPLPSVVPGVDTALRGVLTKVCICVYVLERGVCDRRSCVCVCVVLCGRKHATHPSIPGDGGPTHTDSLFPPCGVVCPPHKPLCCS